MDVLIKLNLMNNTRIVPALIASRSCGDIAVIMSANMVKMASLSG